MAFHKGNMKALAITHLVMAALFFVFGMLDRFEVRFAYSYVGMPCWTSALILMTGILGLIAATRTGPLSATWINTIWSMSIGCVVLCSLMMYFYVTNLAIILQVMYLTRGVNPYSTEKEKPLGRLTDKEQTQLAITSVTLIIAVVEMIVALGSAASCRGNDANYQIMQENMPSYGSPYGGQTPMVMMQQPHGGQVPMMMSSQPVVAVPVSSGYQ